MKIAIIGGGITGLSAAYELSKKGHRVIVFERSKTPGGLGTYIKVGNNYIESFYHHFFESDLEIKRLARELNIQDKLRFYKAKTGIFSENKIYSFSSPSDLLRFYSLSIFNRIRCGITLGFLKLFPFPLSFLDKIPAEKWIKKYAGEKVYEKIWGPLLEGKFSKYAKEIPALWLWGRIKDRSLKLGYFDGSVKILFDNLIKKINEKGNSIKLGSEILEIQSNEKGVKVVTKNSTYSFDKAIITTVSPVANLIIKNGLSENFRNYLNSIDQLGAICVILELKHSIQSQYWLNICDEKSKVLVMVEHTNMIEKKHYGNKTLVYLANYIHRDDRRFKQSDEEIIKDYAGILKTLNKNYKQSWILNSHISRVPRAQTIFKTGALRHLPPIELPAPNLYMANIDQMYPHDRNLDQGIELGKKVADIIFRS
ncbi:MAG: FAD-dependent oxidoreductase [Candidatus Levybacteria bacterium]|nr:FAD-dependent oxidoreductase [Candidatus Levybacteria bacterium]